MNFLLKVPLFDFLYIKFLLHALLVLMKVFFHSLNALLILELFLDVDVVHLLQLGKSGMDLTHLVLIPPLKATHQIFEGLHPPLHCLDILLNCLSKFGIKSLMSCGCNFKLTKLMNEVFLGDFKLLELLANCRFGEAKLNKVHYLLPRKSARYVVHLIFAANKGLILADNVSEIFTFQFEDVFERF